MKRTACKNVVRQFTPAPAPHLRGRRGQVMVVMLLAMTLLVGLVFFVYNLGDQVNRRLATQNTADAVAVSGAGWMARSMNVIAMNNVATARLLGIAPVLDSLPLAVELTLAELPQLEASLERLAAKIHTGAPGQLSQKERAVLVSAIACLIRPYGAPLGTTTKKSDILEAIDEALGAPGFSMEDITHWRISGRPGPPPHGKIWEGVVALGEFSRAAGACAGVLAQHNAVRFGRENGAEDACILPYEPLIPAVQGEFEDFKPVLLGRIAVSEEDGRPSYTKKLADWQDSRWVGGAIPDWSDPHRVGPWGKLFRWWRRLQEWIPTGLVGSGNVPMGGRVSGDNAMSAGYWKDVVPPVHHTYGPYSWALRLMGGYKELRGTHFYRYLDQLADIKMDYMFNPPDDLETILYPEWITDYNIALGIASSDLASIKRTRYYRVRIISSVARGSPNWLGQKTYTDPQTGQEVTVNTFRTNLADPEVFVPWRWYDPNTFAVRKLTGLAIWEDEWVGKHTGAFPDIGLEPKVDQDGKFVEQDFYGLDWWIFGGIDVGEDVDVSNPCNWSSGWPPPGPIKLNTDEGDYDPVDSPDEGYRRRLFTYLGLAGRSTTAGVWPSRFNSDYPDERMVTMAQARVFNNTSWDLWTQDWQVQLVPVTQLDLWKDVLEQGVDRNRLVDERSVDLQSLYDFVQALSPDLTDRYMNH